MKSIVKSVDSIFKKYSLNKTEKKVLGLILEKQHVSVSDIEMHFRVSRTQVTYTLQKLTERQLVHRKLFGKKYLYSARSGVTKKYTQEVTIDAMFEMVRSAKHTRLYGIQSDGAVNSLITRMKKDMRNIEKIHRVQKQRQVIIETIISNKAATAIKKLDGYIKKSHLGRPGIFYILPESLSGEFDIYFDTNTVYIADYRNQTSTVISEKDLASVFIVVFNILKQSSTKKSTTEVYGV